MSYATEYHVNLNAEMKSYAMPTDQKYLKW